MRAADIMTDRVVTVRPDDTLKDAVALMLKRRVSGLPVVDKAGHLAGILTEGDLLRREELGTAPHRPRWVEFFMGRARLADEYTRSHGRKVGDVMTTPVWTVAEETPLDEMVETMTSRRIKRLPVVRDGAVVGIVSRSDVLHALAGALDAKVLAMVPRDAAIRQTILAELHRQSWAPTALINVQVRDGEVELRGTLTDECERKAVRVAVESVPGVTAVHDHLISIEPYSGSVIRSPDEETA